jgi:hypothetical protein
MIHNFIFLGVQDENGQVLSNIVNCNIANAVIGFVLPKSLRIRQTMTAATLYKHISH